MYSQDYRVCRTERDPGGRVWSPSTLQKEGDQNVETAHPDEPDEVRGENPKKTPTGGVKGSPRNE